MSSVDDSRPSGIRRQKLGEGAYGCVVAPAYRCLGLTFSRENAAIAASPDKYVSKLFARPEDAIEEEKMAAAMRAVDPSGNFSVTPIAQCTTTVPTAEFEELCPKVNKSRNMRISRENTYLQMILYPNGGPNLEQCALSGNYSKRQLIKSLTAIITQGLPQMAAAGILHLDIKLDNMVLPKSGVAKFIDFGVSMSYKKALAPGSRLFNSFQFRFPAEFYIMQTGEMRPLSKTHKKLNLIPREVAERLPKDMYNKQVGKFGRELENLHDLSGKTFESMYAVLFVESFDLYSVAYCVADILANPKLRFKTEEDMGAEDRFTEEEGQKLAIWLQNILTNNAFTRWNPAESAEYWNAIWEPTNTYAGAQLFETELIQRARDRMSEAIRTKIFDGSFPYDYRGVDLYRSVSTKRKSPAFQGARGFARGGARKHTTTRRSRSIDVRSKSPSARSRRSASKKRTYR